MTDRPTGPPPLPPDAAQEDFVIRAMALFGEGHLAEVVRICRLGLLADPRRAEGRLVLGRALMHLNKYDDVLAEVGVVLAQDPDNYRALMLKAEALVRLKGYHKAREVLMHVEDLDPFNHQASQLLDYLDEELERAGGPVAHVSTDTRQYPSSKAQQIQVTSETGVFLDHSTAEAISELSTRGGQEEPQVKGPHEAVPVLDDDWEQEESTLMDAAPSFDEPDDTPLQETPTWDGEPSREHSALQAQSTWEGTFSGESPLQAQATVEDAGPLQDWDGGGEVESMDPTVTGEDGWDGGGEVESMEPTVTEGEDPREKGP